MYKRWVQTRFEERQRRPLVDILFGARQTGKTTLLRGLLKPQIACNLADPRERSRLLADPGLFLAECEALAPGSQPALILIDEAQAVPALFDAVQTLYDRDPKRWEFVLSGSSARKLRRTGTNLLPGRSVLQRLHPLMLCERPGPGGLQESRILPMPRGATGDFPEAGLETRLAFGDLPGISLLDRDDERAEVLQSYAAIHLQEEIRRESLVKDWGAFVNFLRLAALESGAITNYSSIARETGVSVPTVKAYYQLLEDMFVGFRVLAFSGSQRKNLLSTPRFLFFDVGVRHAAAGLRPGVDVVRAAPGSTFEQWVGAELHKRLDYLGEGRLCYLRSKSGAEIDYIVEYRNRTIPLEVKWTERPHVSDARHLITFLREQPAVPEAFVVCRCPRPTKLAERVTAIPWQML